MVWYDATPIPIPIPIPVVMVVMVGWVELGWVGSGQVGLVFRVSCDGDVMWCDVM